MKLACSSAPFAPKIDAQRLTQLEWLDFAARELEVDGVVFDARHFPRTDADYVAQLKKMATDLGLTVAGLRCDALGVEQPDAAAELWLGVASGLGAPLVAARCHETANGAWNALVAAAKAWAGEAKRRNVPLAIQNAAGTPCPSVADLKRLAKDVDSSWVRYALDVAALDPPESPDAVLSKTVIATHTVTAWPSEGEQQRLVSTVAALRSFRGFLAIETIGYDPSALGAALPFVRTLLARSVLSL
jgi:hypothetical protein